MRPFQNLPAEHGSIKVGLLSIGVISFAIATTLMIAGVRLLSARPENIESPKSYWLLLSGVALFFIGANVLGRAFQLDKIRRSIGVSVGGRILTLQTVFLLLLLLLFPYTLSIPELLKEGQIASTAIIIAHLGVAFLLVGTATIGYSSLRAWSRSLILFMSWFALGLTIFGLIGLLIRLVWNNFSEWPNESNAVRIYSTVSSMEILSIPLSLWWLYFLNKPSVKQQFQK